MRRTDSVFVSTTMNKERGASAPLLITIINIIIIIMKTKSNNYSATTVAGPAKDTTLAWRGDYRSLLALQIFQKNGFPDEMLIKYPYLGKQPVHLVVAAWERVNMWRKLHNKEALSPEALIIDAARGILLFDDDKYGELTPHIVREHDRIIQEANVA